jgi:hypothetical protein
MIEQLLSSKEAGSMRLDTSRGADDVETLGYTPLMAAAFHDKPEEARAICKSVNPLSRTRVQMHPSVFMDALICFHGCTHLFSWMHSSVVRPTPCLAAPL